MQPTVLDNLSFENAYKGKMGRARTGHSCYSVKDEDLRGRRCILHMALRREVELCVQPTRKVVGVWNAEVSPQQVTSTNRKMKQREHRQEQKVRGEKKKEQR